MHHLTCYLKTKVRKYKKKQKQKSIKKNVVINQENIKFALKS